MSANNFTFKTYYQNFVGDLCGSTPSLLLLNVSVRVRPSSWSQFNQNQSVMSASRNILVSVMSSTRGGDEDDLAKYRDDADVAASDYSDSDSDLSLYDSDGGSDHRLYDNTPSPSAIQDAISTRTVCVSMEIVIVDKKGTAPLDAVASMHAKRGAIDQGENFPPLGKFTPSLMYRDVPHRTMLDWIEKATRFYPSGCSTKGNIFKKRSAFLEQWAQKWKMEQWVQKYIRELDETQGKMIVPFRAETRIATPTPKYTTSPGQPIIDAVRSLMRNSELGDAPKAPMLKEYLDKMYPNHRDTLWGIPEDKSFMGIRFNKHRVPFGCPTPTSRRCADELIPGVSAARGLPKWILLHNAKYSQIVNLIPPWLAYESGIWEFYLYVDHSDTTPVVDRPRSSIRTKPFLSCAHLASTVKAKDLARKNMYMPCVSGSIRTNSFLSCAHLASTVKAKEDLARKNMYMPYVCPLTHGLFLNPVTWGDGQTYEESALKEYMAHQSLPYKSPITKEILVDSDYIPNIALRNALARAIEAGVLTGGLVDEYKDGMKKREKDGEMTLAEE